MDGLAKLKEKYPTKIQNLTQKKPPQNLKTCTKCKKPTPHNEFYKDSKSPDGLGYWCKKCTRKAQQKKKPKKNPKTPTTPKKQKQEQNAEKPEKPPVKEFPPLPDQIKTTTLTPKTINQELKTLIISHMQITNTEGESLKIHLELLQLLEKDRE